MVVALSYILALLITVALALILYPIAAVFWVFGLLGKLSDAMFTFTKRTIAALWRDITNSEEGNTTMRTAETVGTWTCECGCLNTGKFCSECGKQQLVITESASEE